LLAPRWNGAARIARCGGKGFSKHTTSACRQPIFRHQWNRTGAAKVVLMVVCLSTCDPCPAHTCLRFRRGSTTSPSSVACLHFPPLPVLAQRRRMQRVASKSPPVWNFADPLHALGHFSFTSRERAAHFAATGHHFAGDCDSTSDSGFAFAKTFFQWNTIISVFSTFSLPSCCATISTAESWTCSLPVQKKKPSYTVYTAGFGNGQVGLQLLQLHTHRQNDDIDESSACR